jgi:hypothetical protein
LQLLCRTCEKSEDQTRLSKCPVCHKGFCDEHAFTVSGRQFCSRGCGEYFFFANEDD